MFPGHEEGREKNVSPALMAVVRGLHARTSVLSPYSWPLYYYFFEAIAALMAFTTPSLPVSRIVRTMPFFS